GGVRGYAMAALLVSLGVMAIIMTAVLPVWRHEIQREQEAELVFRGESYAKAIARFQRKMGPGVYPTTIQALLDRRFLRKKYKDAMVEAGEFQLIPAGGAAGAPSPGGSPGRAGAPSPARGAQPAAPTGGAARPTQTIPGQSATPGVTTIAGFQGVVSKSK